MQNRKKSAIFFAAVFLLMFFRGVTDAVPVTVDARVEHQEFEGWGTSICWWGNIIGNYPASSRDSIMNLLFDTANGLGLSIIRYNIGGGDNPSHSHMGTGKMMEGFKASQTAQYDWTKDAGQRWVVDAAKKRIPPEWFIAEAFSNSPPYWMTISGCASGNTGGSNNLKTDYYDDFADYLTEVVKHFRYNWGITFRTLEPMNEPMVGWTVNGGQEGCHIDVSLQDDLIREVKAKLDAKGLAETKISAPDESSIDQTLSSWNSYDAVTKSCIFQINTHVYGGSKRAELYSAAVSGNKKLWDSECDGSGAAAPFDQWTHNHNDIVPGLDIANRAIKDLREMKVNGWVFWQAVESEQAQISLNKNWGLIHADFTGGNKYYITKKYYVIRQFSGFIRPFSKMIGINDNDAVAFLSGKQNQLIIVQRNASAAAVSYDYKLSNFQQIGSTVSAWRTSATENFKKVNDLSVVNGTLTAVSPAQSITTYVVTLDPTAAFYQGKPPARHLATIRYSNTALNVEIATPLDRVFLRLYDLRGNMLKSIVLETKSHGISSSTHDLSWLPNGNYLVELECGKRNLFTSKVMLAR